MPATSQKSVVVTESMTIVLGSQDRRTPLMDDLDHIPQSAIRHLWQVSADPRTPPTSAPHPHFTLHLVLSREKPQSALAGARAQEPLRSRWCIWTSPIWMPTSFIFEKVLNLRVGAIWPVPGRVAWLERRATTVEQTLRNIGQT